MFHWRERKKLTNNRTWLLSGIGDFLSTFFLPFLLRRNFWREKKMFEKSVQKIIKALFWHTINRDDSKTTKNLSKDLKIFLLLCVRSESAAHCLFLRLSWTFNSAPFFDTQKATRRSESWDWSPSRSLRKQARRQRATGFVRPGVFKKWIEFLRHFSSRLATRY